MLIDQSGPSSFINTNITGTYNLLRSRTYWYNLTQIKKNLN